MKPVFISNSKIPVWLGKITGTNYWSVSFVIWIWSKGTIGSIMKRHETIHFKQQLELLFVFQWLLSVLFWIIGFIKYGKTYDAYRNNPFEAEAYENQTKKDYLSNRPYYNWTKYISRK